MKFSILTILLTTLTGCNTLLTENNHIDKLVNAVKSVCGAGKVYVQANEQADNKGVNSTFDFECTISEQSTNNLK